MSKDITVFQNKIMGFFVNVIAYRDSLVLIEQTGLDLKTWHLLTERITYLLKLLEKDKLSLLSESNTFSKNNDKINLENVYDCIVEDLKNIYNFYKNVYLMICDKIFGERLTSAVLFFLGEIKKLKIVLHKKYKNESIDINSLEKDAKESIKYYYFSLLKNPFNTRTYFNIGLIKREIFKDFTNSSYWLIRSYTNNIEENTINNKPKNNIQDEDSGSSLSNIKKLKDVLEKDFNIIRKLFNDKEYLIDDNYVYINSDAEHLPILLHRLMGILYMNIDTDKIEELTDSLLIVLNKILKNYKLLKDETKIEYESNLLWEQIVIMLIFNYHYNLNQLEDYPKSNEKIIINSKLDSKNNDYIHCNSRSIFNNNNSSLYNKKPYYTNSDNNRSTTNSTFKIDELNLKYDIYNHNLISIDSKPNNIIIINNNFKYQPKYCFKHTALIIKKIFITVSSNYNKDNKDIVERILLYFFYWFSINYDMYNFVVANECNLSQYLKFIKYTNYYEIRDYNDFEKDYHKNIILNYIHPIEVNYMAFKPMQRFFELNNKKSIIKNDVTFNLNLIVKLSLYNIMSKLGIENENNIICFDNYNTKDNSKIITTTTTIVNKDSTNTFNKIEKSTTQNAVTLNVIKTKTLVLLDMSNIAMRHGNSETFSTKGIKECLDFFICNGHEVSGFLPEYLFKKDESTISSNKWKNNYKRIVPDDINFLIDLYKKGLVIKTPSQDYDDTYNIQYCKNKNAFYVSNDLYRDYTDKICNAKAKEAERRWIISKRISFTFNVDEFIPGPDSEFFNEYKYSDYCQNYFNFRNKK